MSDGKFQYGLGDPVRICTGGEASPIGVVVGQTTYIDGSVSYVVSMYDTERLGAIRHHALVESELVIGWVPPVSE